MTDNYDLPAVLSELLYGDEERESLTETLNRLVTPTFRQRINGAVYDRDQYLSHVREMRLFTRGRGELRVLEEMQLGTRIAGRYLFRMEPEGGPRTFESHLFAKLVDGKIDEMIEVARVTEEGDEIILN